MECPYIGRDDYSTIFTLDVIVKDDAKDNNELVESGINVTEKHHVREINLGDGSVTVRLYSCDVFLTSDLFEFRTDEGLLDVTEYLKDIFYYYNHHVPSYVRNYRPGDNIRHIIVGDDEMQMHDNRTGIYTKKKFMSDNDILIVANKINPYTQQTESTMEINSQRDIYNQGFLDGFRQSLKNNVKD